MGDSDSLDKCRMGPETRDLRTAGSALGPIAAVVGPTASGKSALAMALAGAHGAEILSMDSMQVYRGMDIGTAKPSAAQRGRVRHHLLDLVPSSAVFSVADWLAAAQAALADCRARNVRALLVGGTAMYLAALLHGMFDGPAVDLELRQRLKLQAEQVGAKKLHEELARVDPHSAARLHPNDQKRVLRALEVFEQTGRTLSDWQQQGWSAGTQSQDRGARLVGVDLGQDRAGDQRIRARVEAMLDAGWQAEATALRAGPGFSITSSQALGYQAVLDLADGKVTRAACVDQVALATRQFARRQRTWLRRFPQIAWLGADEPGVCGEFTVEQVERAAQELGWKPT